MQEPGLFPHNRQEITGLLLLASVKTIQHRLVLLNSFLRAPKAIGHKHHLAYLLTTLLILSFADTWRAEMAPSVQFKPTMAASCVKMASTWQGLRLLLLLIFVTPPAVATPATMRISQTLVLMKTLPFKSLRLRQVLPG